MSSSARNACITAFTCTALALSGSGCLAPVGTNADAGVDEASTDASSLPPDVAMPPQPDAGMPPLQKVQMVMLRGDAETVTISCDGGESWAYHAFNAAHLNDGDGPYSLTGLHYDGGAFYLSQGWGGSPPQVNKATDGLDWKPVYQFPANVFLGSVIVSGVHIVLADGSDYRHSGNGGQSFETATSDNGARHLHGFKFNHNGVKMLEYGDGLITQSADLGLTWKTTYAPAAGVDTCATVIAYNENGLLVTIGQTGRVCTSTDDGTTWQFTTQLNGFFYNHKIVWTGTQFLAYGGNSSTVFQSVDGATWTTTSSTGFTPYNQSVVFRNPATGKFYAYGSANTFYRSEDGLAWTLLPPAKQPATTGGTEYMEQLAMGSVDVGPGHPCYK